MVNGRGWDQSVEVCFSVNRRRETCQYFVEIPMLYNMASSHTDSQTVRGRPTLKIKIEIECFRNGLVRELHESKLLRESELSNRRNELLESHYSRLRKYDYIIYINKSKTIL